MDMRISGPPPPFPALLLPAYSSSILAQVIVMALSLSIVLSSYPGFSFFPRNSPFLWNATQPCSFALTSPVFFPRFWEMRQSFPSMTGKTWQHLDLLLWSPACLVRTPVQIFLELMTETIVFMDTSLPLCISEINILFFQDRSLKFVKRIAKIRSGICDWRPERL